MTLSPQFSMNFRDNSKNKNLHNFFCHFSHSIQHIPNLSYKSAHFWIFILKSSDTCAKIFYHRLFTRAGGACVGGSRVVKSYKGHQASKLKYWRIPSYLLLFTFHLYTFPGAPYRVFLLFSSGFSFLALTSNNNKPSISSNMWPLLSKNQLSLTH